MPIYEFETDDGVVLTQFFAMKEAPRIGQGVVIDGMKCKRIPSCPGGRPAWRPYISNRLPRHLPGCDCTPSGRPIVRTQAQERSIASKLGWERQ